jgi:hypothetical protein
MVHTRHPLSRSIQPLLLGSRGWIDPQPNLPARIFLLRLLTHCRRLGD